jgi:hypothetical protein
MEDEVSYIANDARCLSAIEDLDAGMDTSNWLGLYLELYMSVTYGPKDHPRIANCNYQGKPYDAILEFVTLYIKMHHEYEDPFTDP